MRLLIPPQDASLSHFFNLAFSLLPLVMCVATLGMPVSTVAYLAFPLAVMESGSRSCAEVPERATILIVIRSEAERGGQGGLSAFPSSFAFSVGHQAEPCPLVLSKLPCTWAFDRVTHTLCRSPFFLSGNLAHASGLTASGHCRQNAAFLQLYCNVPYYVTIMIYPGWQRWLFLLMAVSSSMNIIEFIPSLISVWCGQ